MRKITFTETVREILSSANNPLTPQEIRERIKVQYPQYYGTESHQNNVQRGNYQNIDHALLAQIYSLAGMNKSFFCDKSHKPMQVSLINVKSNNAVLTGTKMPSNKSDVKNEDDLITNIGHYYKRSLAVLKEFGGPSVYFHIQAIKEQESSFLSDRHIEMIYATLASWGMHRMGDPTKAKAKLREFADFKQSIIINRDKLKEYYNLRMDSCTQEQYGKHIDNLKDIYCSLRVSISDATIVAHSKTFAHILPHLIPPIDRQYTVRFFTQDKKDFFVKSGKYSTVFLPQGIDAQFADFKKYCCRMKSLFDLCDHRMFQIDKNTFNTSFPKIIDNLIMAFVKDVPNPYKATMRE